MARSTKRRLQLHPVRRPQPNLLLPQRTLHLPIQSNPQKPTKASQLLRPRHQLQTRNWTRLPPRARRRPQKPKQRKHPPRSPRRKTRLTNPSLTLKSTTTRQEKAVTSMAKSTSTRPISRATVAATIHKLLKTSERGKMKTSQHLLTARCSPRKSVEPP